MEEQQVLDFIQKNSPDGGFLQSSHWKNFQEAVGRKTYNLCDNNFWANVILHTLPIVGKYFYVPRGPIMTRNTKHETRNINALIKLAKEENVGWIRVEPATVEILEVLRCNIKQSNIKKAPHDMQPREVFIIDISKDKEQLLSEMKSKTRYNIKLAEKKNLEIVVIEKTQKESEEYLAEFLRLVKVTSSRNKISSHPQRYYQKMFSVLPEDMAKIYVAKYDGKVIAANFVVFFGETCTYLHGASDDVYRNLMAPYLLQWKQIQDAKEMGCTKYDFGGVKITENENKWSGITKFKLGFSPNTKPTEFPGSYDVIIDKKKYYLYRLIQKAKEIIYR